jgi:CheY-like chemotaxis protein
MKTILVIDDDEHLRSNLLDTLGFEGYETVGAENGHEGIQSVQEHQPDLIICDITMPVMNGFEVIAALCQDPQTSRIPVIFLSAHKDQATVQKGLQLGAAAHLPKPYNLADLLTAVRAQIGD